MGDNSGGFLRSSDEFHSFVTNDPIMIKLGMGTFTLDTIKECLEDIKDKYGESLSDESFYNDVLINPSKDALFTGNGNTGIWYATKFNASSGKTTSLSTNWSSIKTIIEDFEAAVAELVIEHADKNEAKTKVKAARDTIDGLIGGLHGTEDGEQCYTLDGAILFPTSFDPSIQIKTKLFFHLPAPNGGNGDARERVVASKGAQIISDIARTPTGLAYSRNKSTTARATHHAGLFVKPEASDSITDMVAGKLRISYNDGLGCWESAQTILARLITEIPGATNEPFRMPKEDNGYIKTDSEAALFYEKGSKYYTGNFKTGIAVPVSAKRGNPHMFGPNIIVDYNAKRVEKIRVVNRSEKPFTAGTLVLCTLIGNEWVIQEFGDPGEGIPTSIGTWTFSKLICNSDCFFRNANRDNELWTISTYTERARASFYDDWASKLANGAVSLLSYHNAQDLVSENKGDATGDLAWMSLGYITASSFDSAPFFNKTNADRENEIHDGFLMGHHTLPFWGPMFPDGYYQAGEDADGGSSGINANLYFGQGSFPGERSDIPADIAINGPYDEDGGGLTSPILPLDYFQQLMAGIANSDAESSGSIIDVLYKYRNDIYNSPTVGGPRLTPQNPNKIQFTPLHAEMVVHADPNAPNLNQGRDERSRMKEKLDTDFATQLAAAEQTHMFGKMFDRYSTSLVAGEGLPYDYRILSKPLSKPSGNPGIYNDGDADEGLNMVGITAAINRFTKPGGGSVTMEVAQYFGLPQVKINTVGSTAFSIFTGFFTSGGLSADFPQWGNRSDSYNNFGSTALHCRIFDAWPRKDTIWDTRYFSVMHFAPSAPDEDEEHTDYDFQVPTSNDGTLYLEDAVVNSSSPMKDKSDWTWDTIVRGQLLPFHYYPITVGLDPASLQILVPGENVESDTFEMPAYKIKMNITATGGAVTGATFVTEKYDEDPRSTYVAQKRGEGLDATSFSERYYDASDPDNIIDATGFIIRFGDAVLLFQGKTRKIRRSVWGPLEHGGVKRLTSAVTDDPGVVEGLETTEIALQPNETNEYDAYFYFHNDISHTLAYNWDAWVPGFGQYITLNIS